METKLSTFDLARYIFPEEIFKYFSLCQVEEASDGLHFYFDELHIVPEEYLGDDLESKGFHKSCILKDFPLRDKSVFLHVSRRRWLNKTTGKVVSRDWRLVAKGTHYTDGFAAFLKEFVRYLPDSVQFA